MNIGNLQDWVKDKQRRVAEVPVVVERQVRSESDVLVQLQKDQMLLGRNSDGEPFTPGYLNDSYFKTPQEAQAYLAMKEKRFPEHQQRIQHFLNFPNKAKDTPNLIVTGPFQDSIGIRVDNETYSLLAGYKEAEDIDAKYNHKALGLSLVARKYFYQYYLFEKIYRHLRL